MSGKSHNPKSVKLQVRLTEDEAAVFTALAEDVQLTSSDLIRAALDKAYNLRALAKSNRMKRLYPDWQQVRVPNSEGGETFLVKR